MDQSISEWNPFDALINPCKYAAIAASARGNRTFRTSDELPIRTDPQFIRRSEGAKARWARYRAESTVTPEQKEEARLIAKLKRWIEEAEVKLEIYLKTLDYAKSQNFVLTIPSIEKKISDLQVKIAKLKSQIGVA
jgi:hypothetical protein